jgi:hypothetical protein
MKGHGLICNENQQKVRLRDCFEMPGVLFLPKLASKTIN